MSISKLLILFSFRREYKKLLQKQEQAMTTNTINPSQTTQTVLAADSLADLANYQPLTLANKAGDIHLASPSSTSKSR